MKRTGNLWPQITSFSNLLAAAEAAAAGKRKRPDVAAFLLGMEWELLALQRELLSGEYRTGLTATSGSLTPSRGRYRRHRSGTAWYTMR
jgi:hypothetical protein